MGPQGRYGLEGVNPFQNFRISSNFYLIPNVPPDGDAHPMNPPTILHKGVGLQVGYELERGEPSKHFSVPSSNSPAPKGLTSFFSSPKDGIFSPKSYLTFRRVGPQGSYILEGGNPCQISSHYYPSSHSTKVSSGSLTSPISTSRHQ